MNNAKYSYTEESALVMTHKERTAASILIVEPNAAERDQVIRALRGNGYTKLHPVGDHYTAVKIIPDKHFSHVIFSTTNPNMPLVEFLQTVMNYSQDVVAIPASYEPGVDHVFELLRTGARGFLVKPYTLDSMDTGISLATKGEPFSSIILNAPDRNEAFAAMIAASLDKTAAAQRFAKKYGSILTKDSSVFVDLRRTVELARMFAEGGHDALLSKIEDFFVKLAEGPASRLGRLRRRLRTKRTDVEEEPT